MNDKKYIAKISACLAKNNEYSLLIDMLMFETEKNKKAEIIKKLTSIKEIQDDQELFTYWKSILLNYTRESL